MTDEKINHPSHYGGADNVYEAIKVIRAWGLGFSLGNAVKYLCRAGKKGGESALDDLRKARWYLDNEIAALGGGTLIVHGDVASVVVDEESRVTIELHAEDAIRLLSTMPAKATVVVTSTGPR